MVEESIRVYREGSVENKVEFLSKVLKVGRSIEFSFFPFDVSIFQENVQLVFYFLSRFLGHNNDKSIDEVMLGFIMKVS